DGRIHHAPVHPVHRLVDTGRVDEHDLTGRHVAHTDNPVPGGLRLVGDDGQLLAGESVEQRRLAGVGPAHERDEPGLHSSSRPSTGCGCRRRRTLWMRRPSASRISTSSPSNSKRSPTAGTRPTRESTKPPTVSNAPSSISTPSRSINSS